MVGSDQFVNYRIRPAKSIERKMLLEVIRSLNVFEDLSKYRYIGFGSAFFNDFTLIHKELGLRKLISIEGNVRDAARYRFNLPFGCVKLRMGMSKDLLPHIPWTEPCVVWLDYDYRLSNDVLDDVAYVVSKVRSGSLIFITVDAEPLDEYEARVPEVTRLWRGRRSDAQFRTSALGKWGTAREFRRIIHSTIEEAVSDRPRPIRSRSKYRYQQLLHLEYADGAHHMMSVGGLVFRSDQARRLEEAHLSRFRFVRLGDEPYPLQVPSLTPKEVRALAELLPLRGGKDLSSVPVPPELVSRYSDFYRYYPTFSEVEI